jgi:hypothetical protein
VISYKDIVKAQAQHAARKVAKEGKRSRKRKSPAPAGAKAKEIQRSKVEDKIDTGGIEDYYSVFEV